MLLRALTTSLVLALPATALASEPGGHGEGVHLWWDVLHFGNYEFWGAVINFLLLLMVVMALGRQPLLQYLKTRRLEVEEGLVEAARMREAAEAKHKEYSERLARLDAELADMRADMVKAGEVERDRIVADAEAKAARMRKDTQFIIDQQLKQLRIDLTREAAVAAVAAAEQMLTKHAAAADQERLAADYMERLRSRDSAEGRA